jgi:simple sugar transport system substrate-binding protein
MHPEKGTFSMPTTRRSLLRSSLILPAAAALPAVRARAAEPFKVAFMYVAPIGDAGWTFQHELGRRALVAALGDKVKTTYVENVSEEGADAERVLRKLASEHQLVYSTSFGFMNSTVKVAQAFPKVKFAHATGYKRLPNLSTYSARFYEGRYLTGIVAGRMTKSNVIGFVAAFPIPEVLQGINAMTIGARSVNPKVQVKVIFVSSWFDPGKERAAADTLISQGADIIMHHTDSTAVVQAGEEKGVWSMGYDSDMTKFGPKSHLTAVTMIWDQYYIDKTKDAIAGTWKSDDLWGGIAQGMVKLAPLNPAIPDTVRKEVDEATAKIAAGTLKPFTGPVKDQNGVERIPAGKSLTDEEILNMKWFAEGVQGKI